MSSRKTKLIEKFKKIDNLEIIESHSDVKRLSKDFYNYSPILEEKLDGCIADLVVRPIDKNAVLKVAEICWELNIPLTLRGSGTGNYGQAVPLFKGIVMQMNFLNKLEEFYPDTGFVKVQSGCLMGDLNKQLERFGRELRLLPSTFKTATIGGFIAGGSGGIGSIRWGFLRDPGNVMGLEAVTMNEEPKLLKFDAEESEPLNHAYGTNGIITSLLIATDIKRKWYSLVIDCEELFKTIEILKTCLIAAIDLKLGAILEKGIVDKMPIWFKGESKSHKILIQSTLGGIKTIELICKKYGVESFLLGEEDQLSNGISEVVWNHTTLHMRAKDKNWTYLQMLLPLNKELELINSLKEKWGTNILWHIEAVSQQGVPRLAALPVLKWHSEEQLYLIIDHCKKLGAIIFNPHVLTVEAGGLGVIDSDQVKAKLKFDPKGLLNPGKLEGWEIKDDFNL
ncbi:FAD/FMN-containing dehydrogenase [Prochlorococcus marinus str. MIT 9515]|uniref:FAD/FMN-containing dehydrogenase n=1 Tax=Prochlorococcus marinus (strain MIT 9515) TaxID=167542 RepID=A2BY10_PROM5|nr:FAD-binding oxidoreductase [Prochlorococcus marinus]ABM72671.1 FAD/FMN-containing dehydrogenase [Prochlorococcus marinus str. MIT 9515]